MQVGKNVWPPVIGSKVRYESSMFECPQNENGTVTEVDRDVYWRVKFEDGSHHWYTLGVLRAR